MATITIKYDGRNAIIKKALELVVTAGGIVQEEQPPKKTGIEMGMEDIKYGRYREIKDVKGYFRKLGVNV